MRPLLAATLILFTLAGCGDETSISDGGRVSGDTLTVYSFLPHEGPRAAAAREIELGEKLALQDVHGQAGAFTVNYVARHLPQEQEQAAHATRDVVLDQGLIAVLGDLDSRTARVTVPLLDAAGVLHISPGVTGTGFANPSGQRTFAPVLPDDAAQAEALRRLAKGPIAVEAEGTETARALARAVGDTVPPEKARTIFYAGSDPVNALGIAQSLVDEYPQATIVLPQEVSTADLPWPPEVRFLSAVPAAPQEFESSFRRAYPGRAPTALAALGWASMREVLSTITAAGADARNRRALIEAYMARPRPALQYRLTR